MALKAKLIAGGLTALSVAALSTAGAGLANAQGDHGAALVDKLAQRFNINKDDVQKVFDENRQQHQADRQKMRDDQLQQAVTAGKLTADQKTQLEAKLKDIADTRATLKDKTPQERRDALKAKRDDLKKWASDNHLDLKTLLPHDGKHGKKGHKAHNGQA